MYKEIKINFDELLDFIDQDRLGNWVREHPEIKKMIDKVSKENDGNYYDGLVEIKLIKGKIRIGFEAEGD